MSKHTEAIILRFFMLILNGYLPSAREIVFADLSSECAHLEVKLEEAQASHNPEDLCTVSKVLSLLRDDTKFELSYTKLCWCLVVEHISYYRS